MKYQAILVACGVLLITSCMQTTPIPQWPAESKDRYEWVDLGQSTDGYFRHYLDKIRIKKIGNKIGFVAKIVDTRKVNGQSNFSYVLNEWEINCQQKELRLLQVKIYGKNKELESVKDYKHERQPIAIPKNSIAEKQYQFVCKQ